jgi:hypothetical protein
MGTTLPEQNEHATNASPKTSDAFEYTPISPWEFRLVDLLPGEGAQEISCNLNAATINGPEDFPQHTNIPEPSYFALSYFRGIQMTLSE